MNLLKEAVAALVVAAPAAILLNTAFKSIAVLALAGLAVRCMKACSAASRHLVLALAVGSLLLLPLLSWTLPGWDLLPRWMGVDAVPASRMNLHLGFADLTRESLAGTAAAGGSWKSDFSSPDSPGTASTGSPIDGFEEGALRATAQPTWTPFRWLMTAWVIGFCCTALPTIAGLFSLGQLGRKALRVNSGALAQMVQDLSAELGLRRRIVLLTTSMRRIPMTWGAFHPRILLPAEAAEWPEERQRVVLLHELAHIQRGDFLTNLVAQFARAFYWFNPLVWFAVHEIRREQERACDDIVLSVGTKPASYAEEVLQIAAGHTIGGLESIGAVAMARSSSLEGRLLAILDSRRNRASLSKFGILTAGILMGLAIIPISMLRAAQHVAASAPAAAAVAAEPGLVAWWRGEEDGKDSAGRHDGAFPFGVRYEEGLIGHAFDLRRSYAIEHQLQRVSITDAPEFELSDEMTLEAWIYPSEYGGIVLHRGDDRPGFDTWQVHLMTKGRIDYTFNAADNRATSISAPIQLNQWQHVVVTFDHGAMKLFINGVVAAQGTTELRPIAKLDSRYHPALGIGNVGGTNFSMPFDGLIDEVRIYNRVLSDAEVSERLKR